MFWCCYPSSQYGMRELKFYSFFGEVYAHELRLWSLKVVQSVRQLCFQAGVQSIRRDSCEFFSTIFVIFRCLDSIKIWALLLDDQCLHRMASWQCIWEMSLRLGFGSSVVLMLKKVVLHFYITISSHLIQFGHQRLP